jgi:hypothetical protein
MTWVQIPPLTIFTTSIVGAAPELQNLSKACSEVMYSSRRHHLTTVLIGCHEMKISLSQAE